MDQKSFLASPSSGDESWNGVEEDPSDSLERFPCSSPRSGLSRIKVDVLRTRSLPESLTVPSATKKKTLHHFWAFYTSFVLSLPAWIPDASILSNSSMSATVMSPFQIPPACNAYPRKKTWQHFRTELMQSRQVFSRKGVIFYHRSNRNNTGPSNGTPNHLSKLILYVSQIVVAFHGIRPPFFVQTWLQQHSRRTFFFSVHCSLSNPICFWTVRCWRTMIPG